MKSGEYSSILNQNSIAMKELEKKMNSEMDNLARQWKDQRQKEFYAKYMNRMSDLLNDFARSLNQMALQVKSIENELNRFK